MPCNHVLVSSAIKDLLIATRYLITGIESLARVGGAPQYRTRDLQEVLHKEKILASSLEAVKFKLTSQLPEH